MLREEVLAVSLFSAEEEKDVADTEACVADRV